MSIGTNICFIHLYFFNFISLEYINISDFFISWKILILSKILEMDFNEQYHFLFHLELANTDTLRWRHNIFSSSFWSHILRTKIDYSNCKLFVGGDLSLIYRSNCMCSKLSLQVQPHLQITAKVVKAED